MQAVYPVTPNIFRLTEISTHFAKAFDDLFPPCKPYSDDKGKKPEEIDQTIKRLMDIEMSDEEFKSLKENCSPDNLRMDHDLIDIKRDTLRGDGLFPLQKMPKDDLIQFKTLQDLKKRMDQDVEYSFHNVLKYTGEKVLHDAKPPVTEKLHDLIPGTELVISIRMYCPFVHGSVKNSIFHQCITVLGSQKISVLKDHLPCSNDLSLRYDMSNNPNNVLDLDAKDVFKSGFVYIEDTFYNDLRDPLNIDYSDVIIKWAKKKNLGPFKTRNIEDVRFNELSFHLGYPQVIQHQGTCEHLFVFSNVRVLHPNDACFSDFYPHTHSVLNNRPKLCSFCKEISAKWVVYENPRCINDPSFFCEKCFFSYNYIDGVKVGEFKAYKYQEVSILLHTNN